MTAPRPVPSKEDVLGQYGFVGLLAKAIPELSAILERATREQWTPDRFVQTVADSGWYKATPATTREWITKQITDPASADRETLAGADKIRNLTQQLGLNMPNVQDAGALWLHTRMFNLDEAATAAHLFRQLAPSQEQGGAYGRLVGDMFKMAHDYGYTSGDLSGEILETARRTFSQSGQADSTAWQSKMTAYAEAFYAPYKDDIRGGRTVADIAKPVVDRVAQLLEVNPANVDLSDPLIKKAMTQWNPEGRAYSLREIEDQTRRDSRWKTTDNAKEGAVQMVNEILSKFGMLPGSTSGR